MRIALDAMGGDDAPEQIVAGALESIDSLAEDDELILVGPEETVEAHLKPVGSRRGKISVFNAPDIIGMDAVPNHVGTHGRSARANLPGPCRRLTDDHPVCDLPHLAVQRRPRHVHVE